jgi:hypothetical protein
VDLVTVLRVAFSLAVVMGLLWLSYRIADRSRRGASSDRGAQLTVVARQGLGAKSAAVLLETGGTRYLLGVTESSVTVIDQGPAPDPEPLPVSGRPTRAAHGAVVPRLGPFNVVKSVAAWRSASPDDVAGGPAGGPASTAVAAADSGSTAAPGVPAGPVFPAVTTSPRADRTAGTTSAASVVPSFDEAVLAAQAWLGDDPVLARAGAVASPGTPDSASGLRPGAQTGVRALLVGDTWRQAARSVWGPKR